MREDARTINIDSGAQMQQSSEHDGAIQEVETTPLQAGDTGQEAMTMMQAEGSTDRAPTPQEDNAMFFGGSVLLALLLIAVVAYFITKRNRESAKQGKQPEEPSNSEKKKEP